MKLSRIKGYCMVAGFTVLLYLGLSNLHRLRGVFATAVGLLTPFIIGLVIAFLLGGVMNLFELRAFARLETAERRWVRGLRRPLALVCTYLAAIAALGVLLTVVAPQLARSVTELGRSIPGYLVSLQRMAEQLAVDLRLDQAIWDEINLWLSQMLREMLAFIPEMLKMVPEMLGVMASVGGGVFNFVIGIIVSIYLLISKETLLGQLARINRAFLPAHAADTCAETARVAVRTFSNYVSGQLLDAMIVGALSVILLSVFGFPYAMLIGVVMGITNIIPFFGPFIGAVPGVLVLLTISPTKALWYILLVLVIQQVDGNLIAPRIIGGSVGLPPLWVLFAVTVGGGLFGIVGMVLGTPVFAILYILLGRATRKREAVQSPVPPPEPEII